MSINITSPRLYPGRLWVSHNLPHPPRIKPPFLQPYATLLESTPSSQNITPFSTHICETSSIYPSLPEYAPVFTTIYNAPRNCPSLPQYTIFSTTTCVYATLIYSTHFFQNIPALSTTICDTPRIYPFLPEYTLLFTTICNALRIYPLFYNYTCVYMRPS